MADLGIATTAVDGTALTYDADYERVNYDDSIEMLDVNGGVLGDSFYSDDNSAITSIDGGAGDDSFQFGQLFGADRDAATHDVAPGDEIETVHHDGGLPVEGHQLRDGRSFGGDGDDTFNVYSNQAQLKLFGEADNDLFIVRAFVLDNGDLATANTVLNGGGGNDHFQYAINAPVDIDGGGGEDSVVVVGTEEDDNFVVTSQGVTGAGLAVSFVNIERLEVDGLGGDDNFFVLSTPFGVVTTLVGDNGDDTFNIGGDVTLPIVARAASGQKGFVNHAISSMDPHFNGIWAPGVTVTATLPSAGGGTSVTGGVVTTQSGGSTTVYEDPNDYYAGGPQPPYDSYALALGIGAPAADPTHGSGARVRHGRGDARPVQAARARRRLRPRLTRSRPLVAVAVDRVRLRPDHRRHRLGTHRDRLRGGRPRRRPGRGGHADDRRQPLDVRAVRGTARWTPPTPVWRPRTSRSRSRTRTPRRSSSPRARPAAWRSPRAARARPSRSSSPTRRRPADRGGHAARLQRGSSASVPRP